MTFFVIGNVLNIRVAIKRLLLDPGDGIMLRKQLLNLASRAV
jgi:hypothetical protein